MRSPSADPARRCVPLLLTLGLSTLATGVILGLGTRYGLLRYWWVAVKLVLNLVLTALVLVALRPTLQDGAAASTVVDATLPERLSQVRFNMVFPPLVSTTALVFAAWLGTYKPWGRIGRERRSAGNRRTCSPGTRRRPAGVRHTPEDSECMFFGPGRSRLPGVSGGAARPPRPPST